MRLKDKYAEQLPVEEARGLKGHIELQELQAIARAIVQQVVSLSGMSEEWSRGTCGLLLALKSNTRSGWKDGRRRIGTDAQMRVGELTTSLVRCG